MTRAKKLEEEMAKTSDAQVRRQLQELIKQRKQQKKQIFKKVEGTITKILEEFQDKRTPEQKRADSMRVWTLFTIVVLVLTGIYAGATYVYTYGWTIVGWLNKVLGILEWVVWALVGLWALHSFISWARWSLEHNRLGKISSLLSSIIIIITLPVTAYTDYSQFHLLWFAPSVVLVIRWLFAE